MTTFMDVIPENDTWKIIDSSKLSTYMECPRKYFFEHVLGWKSTYPNNHLIFGVAWHLAVEHFLRHKYSAKSLQEGIEIFYLRYRQDFPDHKTDDGFEPKTPAKGIEALTDYHQIYKDDVNKYQVIQTEMGGCTLFADDTIIYFKIDAILKDRLKKDIVILDHKSSGRHMNYWSQSWNLSTQMLTYIHAAKCMYGQTTPVRGARIRGTFFYKTRSKDRDNRYTSFEETEVQKTDDQMLSWLASTHHWYLRLQDDMEYLLEHEHIENEHMTAFPMNEKSCFLYSKMCPFFNLCDSWVNPLQECHVPPPGLKVEYWDPRDREEQRTFVDLTQMVAQE